MVTKPVEQKFLRIKNSSDVGLALAALEEGPKTEAELQKISGKKGITWILPMIAKVVDNLSYQRDADGQVTMHCINVVSNTAPVPVSVTTSDIYQTQDDATFEDIRWPDAPPLVESLGDIYQEPGWFKTMSAMVKAGRHIAVYGPPGTGKDTAVQELAARTGHILVTIGWDAGFRRKDLVGSPQITNRSSFLDVAEYAAAVVNGWWVLISEVNAADADALMFINSQLAAPYIINIAGKSYPVHPEFRLFVTYNKGLVGTKPLPPAFVDRFYSIGVPFFSNAQLMNILRAHGAPDEAWVLGLADFAKLLWQTHENGNIRYQVTVRRLNDAVLLIKNGCVSSFKEAVRMAVIASIESPIEQKVAAQVLNGMNFDQNF